MSQEQTNSAELNGSFVKITKKLDNVLTMECSVLTTFFQKFPDMSVEKIVSEETDLKDLLKAPTEMAKYWHNPKEPALVLSKNGEVAHKEFWINGHRLSEEEAKKLEHDTNFGKKVQTLIND